MIMSRKKRAGSSLVVQVLDHGLRNSQAIIRTGTTPDFIEDDQAMARGMMNNGSCLLHLNHEGALASRNVIFSADAGENAIDQTKLSLKCWYKATDLCHQCNQGNLTQISRFTSHIG